MVDEGTLNARVAEAKIVVCVGSGGVGKTTTSAVIALHAALEGRRALVLTIDPAKRLANSLGVDNLDNDERAIDLSPFGGGDGELFAMMLDMKRSWDRVIEKYTDDPVRRQKILDSRMYQFFSTSLAGTQDYAAMERLYEIHEEGRYDLIVLDTPPTIHALDFLDAPQRMADAVDSSAMQWLYKPSVAAGKFGLGLFNVGTSYALKTLKKFTGAEMLDELTQFFVNFSHLFEGFGTRAKRVRAFLEDEAAFFVVTSPDPMTVDEARHFRRKLDEEGIRFGGFVVNRVHRGYVAREHLEQAPEVLAARLSDKADLSVQDAEELARQLIENASEFQVLADLDARTLEALEDRLKEGTPIAKVPYFRHDIHSHVGLERVRAALFGPRRSEAR